VSEICSHRLRIDVSLRQMMARAQPLRPHLLEPTGRSFSEHLFDRRLARTVELLRDPAHGPRRIADIAFVAGFRDLSCLNRMLRRKPGGTPTDGHHAPNGWRDRTNATGITI
jgi:AraC-like DNA-binding protein